MATVNSYLRSLVKDYTKSKSSKSVYYNLDKYHTIRVSDHLSTTFGANYFIQIIIPFNKSRTYIVVYERVIMQFKFAELKTFLQTMFLIASRESEKLKKEKQDPSIFEISGTPKEMVNQVKIVYDYFGKFSKKQFKRLLGISTIEELDEKKLMPFLKLEVGRRFFINRKIKVKV